MNIVINPKYIALSEFIHDLTRLDYNSDAILQDSRNRIDKVTADDGAQLVIKRYQVPNLFRRFIYTVSSSKARRSYECALKLQTMGIGTAEPIAYIETARGRLFHTGIFVYSYISHDLINKIEDYPEQDRREIVRDFASFTADMHTKGVRHCDYNPMNIFFCKTETGNYDFALIDINRMRFGKKSKKSSVKEFSRLGFSLPVLVEIAEKYAVIRGWNPLMYCLEIFAYRALNPYWRIKKAFRPLRRFWIKGP